MNEPTALYNYDLPENLIAQTPLADRSASKMLVLQRDTGEIQHRSFQNITEYIRPGDLWIFNDTKVFPARIILAKENGTNIELLFLEEQNQTNKTWKALAKPGKRLSAGTELFLKDTGEIICRVISRLDDGVIEVELANEASLFDILDARGTMPLPPYIKQPLGDPQRYQTVFSREKGSSAAPTAGLHFTEETISKLKEIAEVKFVTLRIGIDTFKPIKAGNLDEHKMHTESVVIPAETAEAIRQTKGRGGRIVAVGTTAVRALESWAVNSENRSGINTPHYPLEFRTNLFIRPGHAFKIVDAMITNFHLPKSTLLVLVSSFAGREKTLTAYLQAAGLQYRFYSFGDAMFII